MSEYIDRIKNHQAWKELEGLGAAIDKALARSGNDAASVDGLERIRTVLTFCGKRLASIDPILVHPTPMGNVSGALLAAKNAVLAFAGDGNPTQITSANGSADEILLALGAIVDIATPDDLTAISESAASYKTTLDGYLRDALATHQAVKSAGAENATKLGELAAEIVAEKQKMAAVLPEVQAQFATAQAGRVTEFTAAQTERQAAHVAAQTERQEKYNANSTENQAAFSAAQEARAKENVDAQADRAAKFTALITDYTQKLAEHHTQLTSDRASAVTASADALKALTETFSAKAAVILAEINTHKSQVEKLVGVIGNLGVTSGYQKVASFARRSLIVWQTLTVVSLGLLVFLAYLIAFTPVVPPLPTAAVPPTTTSKDASKDSPKDAGKDLGRVASLQSSASIAAPASDTVFWQGLATRIFLAVALGVFAAYAARQGDKNQEIERKNRKFALELEAVGPFIAPLPIEMQNKFRAELGDRSFGVPDGGARADDKSPTTALDILNSKEVRDALAEVLKRVDAYKGGK